VLWRLLPAARGCPRPAPVDGLPGGDESRQAFLIEVTVKVVFYGRLADLIGPEVEVDAPSGCSVAELRNRLVARHRGAEQVLLNARSRACVGDAVVHDDHVLTGSDRVEFLPPVSGG
jgi:molybdopterin converting factor small subunit